MKGESQPQIIVDCKDAAESAGLSYATTDKPGFSRRRAGKGFSYRDVDGKRITNPSVISRIGALAIPPAWTSVWICPEPGGHIQATGYDGRGRKQYCYHAQFREVREGVKFEHMMAFADALPRLRRQVRLDMAKPGIGRDKILATVVHLLETTMIRVGNNGYAKDNKSYGLTTLLDRHVKVGGGEFRFHFKGKGGKIWRLSVHDRRIAKIIKSCQELPGQHLFQYLGEDGESQAVTSEDVNAYLKEVTGAQITAKDFRTWSGTVLAAMALSEFERADNTARAKRNVTQAVERVASSLGNTPAICRKGYIHPAIVSAYFDGHLLLEVRKDIDKQFRDEIETLRPEEAAVLAFLRERVARDLAASQEQAKAANGAQPVRRGTTIRQPSPASQQRTRRNKHPKQGSKRAQTAERHPSVARV